MTGFDTIDYFTDPSLVPDPHPYFDHLRRTNPVQQEPHYGVAPVTGYAEAAEVYRNPESFPFRRCRSRPPQTTSVS